jgi:hypothetical protein
MKHRLERFQKVLETSNIAVLEITEGLSVVECCSVALFAPWLVSYSLQFSLPPHCSPSTSSFFTMKSPIILMNF